MVKALACVSRGRDSRGQFPAETLSGNDLGKLFTHVPLSPSSIIWYQSRGSDVLRLGTWEGNRRSGVSPAMRHRLKWFIHLRAQGLSKGDEHPTNTVYGVWYSLLFLRHPAWKQNGEGLFWFWHFINLSLTAPGPTRGPTALPGPLKWSVKTDQYSDITCRCQTT